MTVPVDASSAAPLRLVLARWDRLVRHWDLDEAERTALLGRFDPGASNDGDVGHAGRGERRMRLLVELGSTLDLVHDQRQNARSWLRAPNRQLGGFSPIVLMADSTGWVRWMAANAGLTA